MIKNDKAIIRMGWQNSKMLERIGQANLSAEQLNTIFPASKETSDCGAADGIICVAEITGDKQLIFFTNLRNT